MRLTDLLPEPDIEFENMSDEELKEFGDLLKLTNSIELVPIQSNINTTNNQYPLIIK